MRIKIDGKFFDFFSNITINYRLDSVASTFSISAKFNPENEEHRNIFQPLSYKNIQVYTNENELLLTGYIVSVKFNSSSATSLQTLSGYSKAGTLEDCNIPYSLYPLEKLNVSLDDVVKNILSIFPFSYEVDASVSNGMGLQYQKTVAEPTEKIKDFIAKLASQRNIVLGHTAEGNLLFFKLDISKRPKRLYNASNCLDMSLSANGQSLFSDITVIRQPSKDNASLSPVDTAKNSLVLQDRFLVKILSSGIETDTRKAAENELGKQLKSLSVSISLNYIDTDLRCGDIVEVQNPEIYLFNKTKLVVASMVVSETKEQESMSLTLVLPESFTGDNPKNIFAV